MCCLPHATTPPPLPLFLMASFRPSRPFSDKRDSETITIVLLGILGEGVHARFAIYMAKPIR